MATIQVFILILMRHTTDDEFVVAARKLTMKQTNIKKRVVNIFVSEIL